MSYALPLTGRGPEQTDVDAVRDLLDLMATFRDNDQRARYLLTSDWMRDRGAAAAARLRPRTPVEVPRQAASSRRPSMTPPTTVTGA